MEEYDVIIVGAGAAGLMCAITAGQRGRRVLVLERNDRIGKKILISGGGRCNFTNINAGPGNYLSGKPDFCKSALARFRAADFIALVEKHGIAYHEKKLGQLFCDKSSRDIVTMLEKECRKAGVQIKTGVTVKGIARQEKFKLETSVGDFVAGSLVIATGGLSLPNLGASDFAYETAKQFGVGVTALKAGLVPLVFGGQMREFCRDLSGLSLPCEVRFGKASFTENMLFTHRGVSGPAILQISSYWKEGQEIEVNLFPDEPNALGWLEQRWKREARLDTLLAEKWPKRFAEAWVRLGREPKPMRTYVTAQLQELAEKLKAWKLTPAGTEGYSTAEVTVGGVDTGELHSKTMEARNVAGLYFIGEAVDVTGWLGGYNFQWAWSSGVAAGQAV